MDKPFTFAQRLKTLLDKKGISRSELARTCEIDRSNITRYLNGEYEAKQDVVYRIASKLNINEAWLMGYDAPMMKYETESNKLPSATEEALRQFAMQTVEEQRLVTLYRRADEIDRQTIQNILCRYDNDELEPQPVLIKHYLVPAAAGYASPIEGEDYEEIPLPPGAPTNADYCITIRGDSMSPYIEDGEMVYVKQGAPLRDFEPGIFFVDGDVFCKQWCPGYAGETYLLSANPKREDANITIWKDSGRNCVYLGKVLLDKKLPRPMYM